MKHPPLIVANAILRSIKIFMQSPSIGFIVFGFWL